MLGYEADGMVVGLIGFEQMDTDVVIRTLAVLERCRGRGLARALVAELAHRYPDAALVAEQERGRALAEIRADVAGKATDLAERRIRSALTADDQRTFVQQFLKDAAQG